MVEKAPLELSDKFTQMAAFLPQRVILELIRTIHMVRNGQNAEVNKI